jgi:hypothetical protein
MQQYRHDECVRLVVLLVRSMTAKFFYELYARFAAIPASPLTFLYRLYRKAFSVPFDDPLIALDATSVANNDAIRGFKPFLISV